MIQFFLLLAHVLLANCAPKHYSCDEDYSMPSLDGRCVDGRDKVKLFKADATEYLICPSAKSCFEKGSEVYLNTTKGIYLEDFAVLKTFENSSFHLTGNCFFKLASRSFLANKGKFRCHRASVILFSRSEIVNHGFVEIGESCSFRLTTHSLIFLDTTSRMIVSGESEVRITDYSKLSFEYHFRLHLKLNFDYNFERPGNHSVQFLLQNSSKLHITNAAIFHVIDGKVDVNGKSQIELNDQTSLYVNGILELPSDNHLRLYRNSYMFIGQEEKFGRKTVGSGSLIFAPGITLILNSRCSLTVLKQAHCLVIKYCKIEENMILFPNSTTEFFKCFSNKQDLIHAAAVIVPHDG